MDISIIIPTWNNARRLDGTLTSISQCDIPAGVSHEVIVVNNNCSDDTDEVVKKHEAVLPIRLVHESRPGVSKAKNAGLNNSTGHFVIFTDDDVLLAQCWIAEYWSAHREHGEQAFFGGPIQSMFEGKPPSDAWLAVAMPSIKGQHLGTEKRRIGVEEQHSFAGANWACPRGPLMELGGFDERHGLVGGSGKVRVGEETLLMESLMAQGLERWWLPRAAIKHLVPAEKSTVAHILQRNRAYGYSLEVQEQSTLGSTRRLLGVPLWMWRRYLGFWLKCASGYVRLRPKPMDRIVLERFCGRIDAAREHARNS